MFSIETNVPPPAFHANSPGRRAVYPFAALQVGDSFLATGEHARRAGGAAKIWKRRHPGWDYTTRVEKGGTRVWRMA
jgi:hypothetical protein